jgi:hypothetical protein
MVLQGKEFWLEGLHDQHVNQHKGNHSCVRSLFFYDLAQSGFPYDG